MSTSTPNENETAVIPQEMSNLSFLGTCLSQHFSEFLAMETIISFDMSNSLRAQTFNLLRRHKGRKAEPSHS